MMGVCSFRRELSSLLILIAVVVDDEQFVVVPPHCELINLRQRHLHCSINLLLQPLPAPSLPKHNI